jgi:Fe-S cluster biogenesis protein NfuA
MTPATIVAEQTSDPDTLQFWVGPRAQAAESTPVRTWTDAAEAARAWPLGGALLAIAGVQRVVLGRDFVSITKSPASDWRPLGRAVLQTLRAALGADGLPHVPCAADPEACPAVDPGGADLEARVRALIERDIRPALAADGGDVQLCRVRDGVVELELRGACKDCTGARATLRGYIEQRLRAVPGVREVVAL